IEFERILKEYETFLSTTGNVIEMESKSFICLKVKTLIAKASDCTIKGSKNLLKYLKSEGIIGKIKEFRERAEIEEALQNFCQWRLKKKENAEDFEMCDLL